MSRLESYKTAFLRNILCQWPRKKDMIGDQKVAHSLYTSVSARWNYLLLCVTRYPRIFVTYAYFPTACTFCFNHRTWTAALPVDLPRLFCRLVLTQCKAAERNGARDNPLCNCIFKRTHRVRRMRLQRRNSRFPLFLSPSPCPPR